MFNKQLNRRFLRTPLFILRWPGLLTRSSLRAEAWISLWLSWRSLTRLQAKAPRRPRRSCSSATRRLSKPVTLLHVPA